MLSRFETTDDAQDTKSIDEAKEGGCYERARNEDMAGFHKTARLTRLSTKIHINDYTIHYKL